MNEATTESDYIPPKDNVDTASQVYTTSLDDGSSKPENVQQPPRFFPLIKSLDVELYVVLVMMGYGLQSVTQVNLFQEKACLHLVAVRNLSNSSIDCHDVAHLENFSDFKDASQVMSNDYKLYSSMIETIPAAIWSLFIGPWTDKYGRKAPLIVSVLGMILFAGLLWLNSVNMAWPIGYLLFSPIPFALSGGIVTIFSCSYSHISVMTVSKRRLLRYGLLEMSLFLGIPLGTLLGGEVFDRYGYPLVFGLSMVFGILAIAWGTVFVKEKPRPLLTWDIATVIKDLFNCENIMENVRVCTRPRGRYFRREVLLMMLSMCCNIICYTSVSSISYYFCQKMYGWGVREYSRVSTILSFSVTGIVVLSIFVLLRIMKVKDIYIGIVASISLLAGYATRAFAYKPWIYFAGSFLGAWGGFGPVAIRSRISKIVDVSELGKVFAMLASCESIMPIAGNPLFLEIYNASIGFFPGLAFLVGSVVSVVPLCIFIWLVSVSRSAEYQLLEALGNPIENVANPSSTIEAVASMEDDESKPILS